MNSNVAVEVVTIDEEVALTTTASTQWAKTPYTDRARILQSIADALDAAAAKLIAIAGEETRLSQPRLASELKRTTFQLRLFADVAERGAFLDVRIDRADPEWPMGVPRPDLRRMLVPIGPALVFAASNFPFAFSVAGGDTAAALAAGNAVLVKAHSGHPQLSDVTAEVVSQAVIEAGGPANLLRVIHGTERGVEALRHPQIKVASFTGSISAGRALYDIANARPTPIPFYGELGSVNPAFVAPRAAQTRPTEIAEGYLASISGSQGQLCTKPGVLFVPRDSTIIEALSTSPLPDPAPLLNDRIQNGYADSLRDLRNHVGITSVRDAEEDLSKDPGVTLLHIDIDDVIKDPHGTITEIFGPFGLIVSYTDPAELSAVAEALEGQLTATLLADIDEDREVANNLIPLLTEKAGRLLWNQWPTGVSVTHAQQHGGPYPATTAPLTTAVGTASIARFLRPVAFQNFPAELLPEPLRDHNPLGVPQSTD